MGWGLKIACPSIISVNSLRYTTHVEELINKAGDKTVHIATHSNPRGFVGNNKSSERNIMSLTMHPWCII